MTLIHVHGPKLKYYINRFAGIGMEINFIPKQILRFQILGIVLALLVFVQYIGYNNDLSFMGACNSDESDVLLLEKFIG